MFGCRQLLGAGDRHRRRAAAERRAALAAVAHHAGLQHGRADRQRTAAAAGRRLHQRHSPDLHWTYVSCMSRSRHTHNTLFNTNHINVIP